MSLTAAQIDARRGKLTASRVACLMTSDAVAIMRLYQEMVGDAEPEDLSRVWPVQLGALTEHLNLDWYAMKNGNVSRRGAVAVHSSLPWAAATLDGWDETLGCPIECKHVGGREPMEVIIDRYQPQMQWQMLVTDATQCAFSVIFGANEPIVEYIDFDPTYAAEMVRRGKQFMACVAKKVLPVALEPVPAPVDATKVYDMTGSNEWADAAVRWLENIAPAGVAKNAEKVLKSLVPADAKKCHGYDVHITRDRAGRLSLREAKT